MKQSVKFIIFSLLIFSLAVGCGDDDDDDNDSDANDDADDDVNDDADDDVNDDADDDADDDLNDDLDDDTDPGDPLLPSEQYLARQQEYLEQCAENGGNMHAQVCKLTMGYDAIDEDAIDNTCNKMNNREDCADFDLASLLRFLYLHGDNPAISAETMQQIKDALLNFKYWMDEPNEDEMCFWSENHQILFHSAELLAGQLYPNEIFPNANMTGQEHIDHALPMIRRWLAWRGKIGFVEWHSNVYFNEDIPALTNLVDFSEDEDISTQAAMLLDVMAFDFANNYFKDAYATTHGRTYPSKLIEGSNDSTDEAAWVMLGIGEYDTGANFSGVALASSTKYWPSPILEDIAEDALDWNEHRERDSIDIDDGPYWGVGYESHEDVTFWWSLSSYAASKVLPGTFQMVDDYNMWETNGFLFETLSFLSFLVGSPLLEIVPAALDEMTRGPALESVNTYTYRTPDYQLSGAQDYNKGLWGGQQHIWQATLDADANVFTTYPGGLAGDYLASDWTGGWFPRATFFENIGIIQYQRRQIPLLDDLIFISYTHAHFPTWAMDEWTQSGKWTFGAKGDSYVALYSDLPTAWADTEPESTYELIADGISNVWIVELGCADDNGSFEQFMADIENASVTVGEDGVEYNSPSQGLATVAWDGPFVIEGINVDIGPYARWDNAYSQTEFGSERTIIEFGGQTLDLDFAGVRRRYFSGE